MKARNVFTDSCWLWSRVGERKSWGGASIRWWMDQTLWILSFAPSWLLVFYLQLITAADPRWRKEKCVEIAEPAALRDGCWSMLAIDEEPVRAIPSTFLPNPNPSTDRPTISAFQSCYYSRQIFKLLWQNSAFQSHSEHLKGRGKMSVHVCGDNFCVRRWNKEDGLIQSPTCTREDTTKKIVNLTKRPVLAGRLTFKMALLVTRPPKNIKKAFNNIQTGVNTCPKNLKLSLLKFGVFWNCLAWSTRKSSYF